MHNIFQAYAYRDAMHMLILVWRIRVPGVANCIFKRHPESCLYLREEQ